MLDEDWRVVLSLLPGNWRELALQADALKGLRKNKSLENPLRTLLIHLAGGYSLRETALRARQAGLAELSDVAVMKRLRKSREWLAQMCRCLLVDRGLELQQSRALRLVDATTVKEPGKTGSLWRMHYSVDLPSLQCDHFKVTPSRGRGHGEQLQQFPLRPGDHVVADRVYATAGGIEYASERRALVLLRMSPHNLVVGDSAHERVPWQEYLSSLTETSQVRAWPVIVEGPRGRIIPGRVCAVRKTQEAIRQALKRLRRRVQKTGSELREDTLFYAQYVILFTTFEQDRFGPVELLNCYRLRWQIELVFKRFKQIAQLGHLPKYDEESSKAWLYGKILVALLTEKLIAQARAFSPWGSDLAPESAGESVA